MAEEKDGEARLAHAASLSRHRAIENLERAGRGRSLEERQMVECARKLMKGRAEIAKLIPANLFRDSAWDVMLDLFVNGEEGGIIYVKQLIIASGQAGASAVRVIDRLEGAELIRRRPDPLDHRRIIVELTERGRTAMMAVLSKLSELKSGFPQEAATPRAFQPRGY